MKPLKIAATAVAVLLFVYISAAQSSESVRPTAAEVEPLTKLIEKDPQDRKSLLARAEIYCTGADPQKGITDYTALINEGRGLGYLHNKLGECLRKANQSEQAILNFLYAGWELLSEAEGPTALSYFTMAEKAFGEVLKAKPDSGPALVGRGVARYKMSVASYGVGVKEAISDLTKGLGLPLDKHTKPFGLYYRGNAHFGRGPVPIRHWS